MTLDERGLDPGLCSGGFFFVFRPAFSRPRLHVTAKIVAQTKQTEDILHCRPKVQKGKISIWCGTYDLYIT